jgi:hypothetical protein
MDVEGLGVLPYMPPYISLVPGPFTEKLRNLYIFMIVKGG